MNNCEDKIKASCPPNSPYAACVRTEVTIPEFSTLTSTCNSIQEVEGDMYTLIGNIKEEINLTSITSDCETLPISKTVLTLIQYLIDNVCTQKTQIEALITQNAAQALEITQLQSQVCP